MQLYLQEIHDRRPSWWVAGFKRLSMWNSDVRRDERLGLILALASCPKSQLEVLANFNRALTNFIFSPFLSSLLISFEFVKSHNFRIFKFHTFCYPFLFLIFLIIAGDTYKHITSLQYDSGEKQSVRLVIHSWMPCRSSNRWDKLLLTINKHSVCFFWGRGQPNVYEAILGSENFPPVTRKYSFSESDNIVIRSLLGLPIS